MREMNDSWARRKRIHNDRSIAHAVFVVALLLVIAEISGFMGWW